MSIVSHPNSLLLIGATKDQALSLAKEMLGNSVKVDSGNHPDLHLYTPEGKAELHPIANIHQMIEEMSLPPFEAKCKVFIIEGAEKMLPSSSNALLKTLEEPNPDTYFLLLSDHPDRLLPTVRSRLYPIDYERTETAATDFSHYIALAEAQRWDRLLEELPDEGAEDFFRTYLKWAAEKKSIKLFQKVSTLVEQAEKALQHNVKSRTVFLNLLLQIAPDGIY